MSVDGSATRREHGVLSDSSLPIPCVLRESYLPPTGAAPFDSRRGSRELSSEAETNGNGSFACSRG
jgi:hypothetical protein